MKPKLWIGCLIAALLLVGTVAAQDATPEATSEATVEATPTAEGLLEFPGVGSYTVRQNENDLQRTYRVYIPTTYDAAGDPVALVLVLHGAGGTGGGTESFTGFDDLAEQEDFIVAYPDGYQNVWNDGRGGDPRVSAEIDDVKFLSDVIGFIGNKLNIDPLRVYSAGYSMGGMMSYRLGCDLNGQLAGIASVASTMPIYLIHNCNQTAPVPVVVFQGTDDPIVPWVGVPNGYLSAAQTLGFWGNHNQCGTNFTIDALADTAPDDATRVLYQTLPDCPGAANVSLYSVYLGGHTWPGHPFQAGVNLGLTTHDLDATALIWQFFKDHPKAAVSATEEP